MRVRLVIGGLSKALPWKQSRAASNDPPTEVSYAANIPEEIVLTKIAAVNHEWWQEIRGILARVVHRFFFSESARRKLGSAAKS